MIRYLLLFAVLLLLASPASAQGPLRRLFGPPASSCPAGGCPTAMVAAPPAQATATATVTTAPVPVIPAGYHSHTTTDGRMIVHADSNQGNAAAHAGVAYPWVKTAVGGQAAPAPVSVGYHYAESASYSESAGLFPRVRAVFAVRPRVLARLFGGCGG